MTNLLRAASITVMLAAITGCSTIAQIAAIDRDADSLHDTASSAQEDFRQQASDGSRRINHLVDRPWITGKAQPLAREVTLPPALRGQVNTTLLFADGAVDLVALAERIHQATGTPVRVEPDALMPREAFLPRLATERAELVTPPPTTSDTLVPALAVIGAEPRLSGPGGGTPSDRVRWSGGPGHAPLANLLDSISLRLGVYWRYDTDAQALVIYRTETRAYDVRALALATQTDLELGLTGSAGGDAKAGGGKFASQNRSRFTAPNDQRALAAVIGKVSQLLTRAGVVTAPEGASNSIIVTDTKDALDRVGRFLERENRALTRRVRLVFEEVTVQRTDTGQAAVDWSLLFNSGGRGNTGTLTGVGNLLDTAQAAGAIGGTVGAGPFSGSNLTLRALSQLGTVVRHTTMPLLALNRRPATFAVRESFSYIKDLQQTQSTSDSTQPTVTVTQEDETVGTFLTVVPDAQDDGQVLLSLAYDDTRLNGPLERLEFGSPQAPSFVQQPRINGQGAIQQVELRPGQPIVVAGFEQDADNYTHRRLDRDAPIALGGSDATTRQRLLTVLIVTALPQEGF